MVIVLGERPGKWGRAGWVCCSWVAVAGWCTGSTVSPHPSPAHQRSPGDYLRPRQYMPVREDMLGLMPSRYKRGTLPYTSHSRERVYSVSAVKLLAPAILLRSLMSIPPVFQEDGLGEVGQQRSMLKWG